VSTSAADMSARILGENNNMTRCLHPSGHKAPRAPGPGSAALTLSESCSHPVRQRRLLHLVRFQCQA
jgi:hypothetical protein